MPRPKLSDRVRGVAAKRLSAVEAEPRVSNQHEFHGVAALRQLLGQDRQEFAARHLYLADSDEDKLTFDGRLTWYDSRKKTPNRTEFRLYYTGSEVADKMSAGDLMVLGLLTDGTALVVVAKKDSAAESQLRWLFGLQADLYGGAAFPVEGNVDRELGLAARAVLSELDIEAADDGADWLEVVRDKFPDGLPSTARFAAFARETLGDQVSARDDPDATLIAWLERETALFMAWERDMVLRRLQQGFDDDVEAFVEFSKSVQNRRKARAGLSLEHHVESIVREHDLAYTRGGRTEVKSKPDFIFPTIDQYRDRHFDESRLTMLGAKTSCKDRWRQVLKEAARIPDKHLLTLEPGISEAQTDEMRRHQLQLVLPRALHETYLPSQREWLWDMDRFLALVADRQQAQD
ncbi:MAG: type II restriction endonuclease [Caldilineaceae bacterium]|nr:type II restriction endonuclease [Caldilineaceae bacterium]